jgi:tetratricopeptide (TPR) repeat protein
VAWAAAAAIVLWARPRLTFAKIEPRASLWSVLFLYLALLGCVYLLSPPSVYVALLAPPSLVFAAAALLAYRVRREVRFLRLLRDGQLDEAMERTQAALQRRPNWMAYNRLGGIHHIREEWAQAREAFEQAERLFPKSPVVRANKGLAMVKAGDLDGIAVLERGRVEIPAEPAVRVNLARAYVSVGRLEEARKEYGAALQLADRPRVFGSVGRGQLARALERCRHELERAESLSGGGGNLTQT